MVPAIYYRILSLISYQEPGFSEHAAPFDNCLLAKFDNGPGLSVLKKKSWERISTNTYIYYNLVEYKIRFKIRFKIRNPICPQKRQNHIPNVYFYTPTPATRALRLRTCAL